MAMLLSISQDIAKVSKDLKPFAIKLTHDENEANDLIQDTVYRALIHQDKFQRGTNLKAWLSTIMRNTFINNCRKTSRRKTLLDATDNSYYINIASPSSMVTNRAEGGFVLEDVMKEITELKEDYRIPFMMYFNGFHYDEISEALDKPLGTIKSRIFFARRILREVLKGYALEKRLN